MSRISWKAPTSVLAALLAVGFTAATVAQQPTAPQPAPGATNQNRTAGDQHRNAQAGGGAKTEMASAMRSSKLSGMNVKNPQGEDLGTVNDIVIDIKDGRVSYVAVSVGGFLGVGDKLLAIPFHELTFRHGQDDMHFVLNATKEKLEAAPGFASDSWPDVADPKWRSTIDNHYRRAAQDRPATTR